MEKTTESAEIIKVHDNKRERLTDTIIIEAPLTIFLNGEEVVTTVYTPPKAEALAVGFLLAEGFLEKKAEITSLSFCADIQAVHVILSVNRMPMQKSKKTITSGCGGGMSFKSSRESTADEKINSRMTVTSEEINKLMNEMNQLATYHRTTGGTHCSAICKNGKIIVFAEDIGRHNTLDKIFGECFLTDLALDDAMILTSGRATSEMVAKVVKSRVPVLASRSAPTNLAIKMAQSCGLTLIGFVRGSRMNVYTHEWRVTSPAG